MLIVDEVQSGFGRTGKLFAIEHFGVEPDLITVAKSIAAGVPMSGVLGRAELMDAPHDSAIGGTYVGRRWAASPGSRCSTSSSSADLLARGTAIGDRIRRASRGCARLHPQVGDVRGLGPMLALEFVTDPATKEPAPAIATAVFEQAAQRGLILLKAGLDGNCIRVLVPLVATTSSSTRRSTSSPRRSRSPAGRRAGGRRRLARGAGPRTGSRRVRLPGRRRVAGGPHGRHQDPRRR